MVAAKLQLRPAPTSGGLQMGESVIVQLLDALQGGGGSHGSEDTEAHGRDRPPGSNATTSR